MNLEDVPLFPVDPAAAAAAAFSATSLASLTFSSAAARFHHHTVWWAASRCAKAGPAANAAANARRVSRAILPFPFFRFLIVPDSISRKIRTVDIFGGRFEGFLKRNIGLAFIYRGGSFCYVVVFHPATTKKSYETNLDFVGTLLRVPEWVARSGPEVGPDPPWSIRDP